jgi:hypothetical protein
LNLEHPDVLRERMIDITKLKYLATKDTEERRLLFDELRVLIRGRSAAQVERMETERGLR